MRLEYSDKTPFQLEHFLWTLRTCSRYLEGPRNIALCVSKKFVTVRHINQKILTKTLKNFSRHEILSILATSVLIWWVLIRWGLFKNTTKKWLTQNLNLLFVQIFFTLLLPSTFPFLFLLTIAIKKATFIQWLKNRKENVELKVIIQSSMENFKQEEYKPLRCV